MKRHLAFCVLMFWGITAFGQALTQADRDKGTQYLEQTRDGVVTAVKGLSDAQLKFKAGPDRWSVAETLEHIALAEDFIFQNVTANVMKAATRSKRLDLWFRLDAGRRLKVSTTS